MKITIRGNEKVVIEGYVNAVDRFSRPIFDNAIGRFVEKILPSVFKRAIAKSRDVKVLLNHDESRELASTAEGTAKLYEDNVGLRAVVEITDAEVIEKAKAGKLRGWSFGFTDADDERTTNKEGIVERTIRSLALHEVSIIDDRLMPVYFGTSIETRGTTAVEIRASDDTEVETENDADGGEEKPDTETDTNNPDSSNPSDDDEAKAKIADETRQRENDLRGASI